MNATLTCLNHSALVSWVGSPSAIRYNVTLTGQDGHVLHCQTNSTSCRIPDIHCGQTYDITVTPYSETCAGHPSAIYTFPAGTERLEIRHPESSCSKNVLRDTQTLNPFPCPPVQVSVLPATSTCLKHVRAASCPGLT